MKKEQRKTKRKEARGEKKKQTNLAHLAGKWKYFLWDKIKVQYLKQGYF